MLEKHLWRDFVAVTSSVAVLVAGSVYTLSMVSSGERFSGAALLRASGLIAFTWSMASSVGPAATGIVVQHFGGNAMTAVLWLMALGFVLAERLGSRHPCPRTVHAESDS